MQVRKRANAKHATMERPVTERALASRVRQWAFKHKGTLDSLQQIVMQGLFCASTKPSTLLKTLHSHAGCYVHKVSKLRPLTCKRRPIS
eukprot:6060094-Amphidinium_carterae.1